MHCQSEADILKRYKKRGARYSDGMSDKMKRYTIETAPMQAHITKPSVVYNQNNLTEREANKLFDAACEKYGCDRVIEEGSNKIAGGIGYDYRIELILEN